MKIIQFMASQKWGGAEKVFVELSNELAHHHEVYAIILRSTEYRHRFSQNVQLVELTSHPTRNNPFLFLELKSLLTTINADIIHTHADKATELVHMVSLLRKLRHIATKHNSRKGNIFNRLPWVTVVSKDAHGSLQNPNGRVEIIYNGIRRKEIKNVHKNNLFSIIAVGRLDWYKGFDVLLKDLAEVEFDFTLRIVGEGSQRKNLARLIKELRLQERVFLLGHREDVPELLNQSHLQVSSSRTEGFSLAVIEGLTYSDVLLSTKVGIAAEIMPDELLIDGNNIAAKISEVHSDYPRFFRLFKSVKEENKDRFLMKTISNNYLKYYEEVLFSQR